MRVKDLIELLRQMPQDKNISVSYLSGEDGGFCEETEADIIKVTEDEKEVYIQSYEDDWK